jgi:hypothetical protein
MNAASWNLALGDSVTRVMVHDYSDVPAWNDWRRFTQQVYGLTSAPSPGTASAATASCPR